MFMRRWDMIWQAGLLIAVVVLAIVDAIKRAVLSSGRSSLFGGAFRVDVKGGNCKEVHDAQVPTSDGRCPRISPVKLGPIPG
jgi:hypothetical protein